MLRYLCIGLLSCLIPNGSAVADFTIDNFSNGDQFSASNSGGTTADIADNAMLYSPGPPEVYQSVGVTPGVDRLTVTYSNFGLAGLTLEALAGPGTGPLTSLSIASSPSLAGDWDLTVSGSTFGPVTSSPASNDQTVNIGVALRTTTFITFDWLYTGGSGTGFPGIVSFGGIAGLVATPEPASLLMFGTGMGLLLTRRRRK